MQRTNEMTDWFRKDPARALRIVRWGGALCLLALPAIAMQFTNEVAWTAADFVVGGGLLFGACGAYEIGAWLAPSKAYRIGAGFAILATLLVVWAELAVGIFD